MDTPVRKVRRTDPIVGEVTRVLRQAGYQVGPGGKTLDDDLCLSVTDPKSPIGAHCLVAFWPSTRAWPLAVYRGDEMWNTCDSTRELLRMVRTCLASRI